MDTTHTTLNPKIDPSWLSVLKEEFEQPYFLQLKQFLSAEKSAGKIIYPPGSLIFNAFNSTPFDQVKVVILGQDPYHGPKQAHGLCFSVPFGVKPPPSLVNIFKEIKDDLQLPIPNHGNLQHWTEEGVFLLNAILTVEAGQPASHQQKGWENYTDAVIRKLSEQKEGLVFLLWGRFAQDKSSLIDGTKHHILKAAHPSPFSAYQGFFGCKHFSKTNELLEQQGKVPVDWKLPNM
jgi:uracil-DNA glycosylase